MTRTSIKYTTRGVICYHLNKSIFNDIFVGMLLRLFMYMYDLEMIDEESFTRWEEEVNDEYPGKGKALFQVCHCDILVDS